MLRLTGLWYGLGLAMLLVVGVLSLLPMPDVGVDDKLSHLVVYFVLAAWFSLLAGGRFALLWIVAGLVAYGVLLELLQGMTDFRYPELADNFANAGGALLGVTVYFTPAPRLLDYLDRLLARILRI